jgi:hypothetical protein
MLILAMELCANIMQFFHNEEIKNAKQNKKAPKIGAFLHFLHGACI